MKIRREWPADVFMISCALLCIALLFFWLHFNFTAGIEYLYLLSTKKLIYAMKSNTRQYDMMQHDEILASLFQNCQTRNRIKFSCYSNYSNIILDTQEYPCNKHFTSLMNLKHVMVSGLTPCFELLCIALHCCASLSIWIVVELYDLCLLCWALLSGLLCFTKMVIIIVLALHCFAWSSNFALCCIAALPSILYASHHLIYKAISRIVNPLLSWIYSGMGLQRSSLT